MDSGVIEELYAGQSLGDAAQAALAYEGKCSVKHYPLCWLCKSLRTLLALVDFLSINLNGLFLLVLNLALPCRRQSRRR